MTVLRWRYDAEMFPFPEILDTERPVIDRISFEASADNKIFYKST